MTGTRRVGGELLDGGVAEDAQHHGIDVLAHDAGEVGDALARAQADLVAAEEDAGAAQLGHGRLEADARAQRRLLEDQAEDAARQERRVFAALPRRLEARRLVQQVVDLVRAQIEQSRESDAWLLPDR